MISLSVTTIPANTATQMSITFAGSAERPEGFIWSEDQNIQLSRDGTTWTDELGYYQYGTYRIYLKPVNTAGIYTLNWDEADNWEIIDEGTIDITVTGGTPSYYESVNFSFAPRNATVQYNINAVNTQTSVGQQITGTILDHNYKFEVERVAEQGAKSIINGAAYADKLVNTLIQYKVEYDWDIGTLGWERPKFSDHLRELSGAIGIPIVRIGADFYPKTEINIAQKKGLTLNFYEVFNGSFSELLNNLIGWSDTVPGLTYNLYIQNNTIYIVQQGSEQNTRTPVNWVTTPTITHTKRHTEWKTPQYSDIPKEVVSSDNSSSNEPFSGTITWGDTTLTYEDGYLITEEKDDGQGTTIVTTTYTYTAYDDYKYLTRKETTDTIEGTFTETEYRYETTGEERYLFEEEVAVYTGTSAAQGILEQRTLTRHVPIGNGYYGTTVYDTSDLLGPEVEVSTSLGQGAPGNRVNQYMVNAANDALKPSGSTRTLHVPLNSVAKARQSYPIANLENFTNGIGLRQIATNLDLYENKEEITINGTIIGDSHIYTYNDKIVYNGQEYHLVSNAVTQTPATIRQDITAVRWVLS